MGEAPYRALVHLPIDDYTCVENGFQFLLIPSCLIPSFPLLFQNQPASPQCLIPASPLLFRKPAPSPSSPHPFIPSSPLLFQNQHNSPHPLTPACFFKISPLPLIPSPPQKPPPPGGGVFRPIGVTRRPPRRGCIHASSALYPRKETFSVLGRFRSISEKLVPRMIRVSDTAMGK